MGTRPSNGVYKTHFDLTGTVRWGIGGRLLVFTVLIGWHCDKVQGHAELEIEKPRVKTLG